MGWTNNDGLYIRFHADKVTGNTGEGRLPSAGQLEWVEVELIGTALGTAAAVMAEGVMIPSGVRIETVEVIAETAATSGGAAVLNVGLIRLDRSTELDYDGLVAAAALATINANGEKNTLIVGSTGAGALVGTTLAYPGLVTADYDTAAFTAGVIKVRIGFYVP